MGGFDSNWFTPTEISFLDNVPNWAKPQPWHEDLTHPPKSVYLKHIVEGYHKRVEWGILDRCHIIAHAEWLLKRALEEEANE